MAARVLVDSGFWFALWDIRDGDLRHPERHRLAQKLEDELDEFRLGEVVLPWPTLYETLCTRFVGRKAWAEALLKKLEQPNYLKLDDEKYRDDALSEVRFALGQRRKLSLVDAVLRQMLQDKTQGIKGIITFNARDFSDICYPYDQRIYPNPADY